MALLVLFTQLLSISLLHLLRTFIIHQIGGMSIGYWLSRQQSRTGRTVHLESVRHSIYLHSSSNSSWARPSHSLSSLNFSTSTSSHSPLILLVDLDQSVVVTLLPNFTSHLLPRHTKVYVLPRLLLFSSFYSPNLFTWISCPHLLFLLLNLSQIISAMPF